MAIVRWKNNRFLDPFEELSKLQDEINNIFNLPEYGGSTGLFDRTMSPPVDIIERNDDYVVYCDMPGVEKKDLDISIASNVLTIKGEKKELKKEQKTYRKDTWTGTFQRTLSLPKMVDTEKIQAELSDGVLKLTIPKKEEVKTKQINVNVQ